jgi:sulfur-oxidizing protein SoxA
MMINPIIAAPQDDKQAFQNYFQEKFPKVALQDFSNGIYAIDPSSREQWLSKETQSPYQADIDKGKSIYQNSPALKSCFANAERGIAQDYPHFDDDRKQVVTLALAVNECLQNNGEETLGYKQGKIASLLAYFSFQSRGAMINTVIPSEGARQAYEKGKQFFYARRGQLNFACAHCHVDNVGKRIRSSLISPALGHTSHFPVYRKKWRGLGTLHKRFAVCNEQSRAKAFPAQSEEYRNLEYFLSYMSNGIQLNGPGWRK